MITTKLIEQLQLLVEQHRPVEDVMGPHEIVIDVFEKAEGYDHLFKYKGFSPFIQIDKSSDGVYDILSAFSAEEKK